MLVSSYKDKTIISSVVLEEHYEVFTPVNIDLSHIHYGRGCQSMVFQKKY
jgi:hypothetical protein